MCTGDNATQSQLNRTEQNAQRNYQICLKCDNSETSNNDFYGMTFLIETILGYSTCVERKTNRTTIYLLVNKRIDVGKLRY